MKVLHIGLLFLAVLLWPAASLRARTSSAPKTQSQSTIEEAKARLALSEKQNNDDHVLALRTAQEALALWQSVGDNAGIAHSYAQIGRCYFAQSNLPEAIQSYEQALQIWRDLHNPAEESEILIMLGYIEQRKGEWKNSIAFYTQAEDLIEGTNEPIQMGQIATGLATLFNEAGLPESGLIQFERALSFSRQTSDTRDDIRAILSIGNTYYLLGHYQEAIALLEQALAGFDSNSLDAAQCHEYLGRVYVATGNDDIALQHLQLALPVYTRAKNPQEAAQVNGLIGLAYQRLGRLDEARRYYELALESSIRLEDRINQAAVCYALGRLALQQNNLDRAEAYLRRAIDVTENIRRIPSNRDLTAAFSSTINERYQKYAECLMRKNQMDSAQGFDVRAFEVSDLSRARSLAELLRATQTNLVSGLDPQLAVQEKSLRQALLVKEDYKVALLGTAYRKEELDALEAELGRLQNEYNQLTEAIRARYPSFEKITQPAGWSLKQIQEEVVSDDQSVLLEYSLGEDRSYVWAVTRNNIKSYELPPRALIEEAATKVHGLLSASPPARNPGELDAEINALSQMILSPVSLDPKHPRVIVVADGALNYIPFQILSLPEAQKKEPLLARYEITNAPSAAILGELRQEATNRHPAAKLLAAFGDPVFATNYASRRAANAPELIAVAQEPGSDGAKPVLRDIELKGGSFDPSVIEPLHDAGDELNSIGNMAGRDGAFVAAGFTATRQRLLATDLTQYRILHFATHGQLDPKLPERSGLILSTVDSEGKTIEGFVGLQDIYGLRAPVDLVVLSSCQSALGKDVRGEGLLGLTRGFMYAGASSVVSSLWEVSDESTAVLMKEFYRNMLERGMTPAAALRAAQNSIRQMPDYRSPHQWAGFTLHGVSRHILGSTPPAGVTLLPIIIGAALLVLLLGGFRFYRWRRLSAPREN